MSGYCRDCGNTLCVCSELEGSIGVHELVDGLQQKLTAQAEWIREQMELMDSLVNMDHMSSREAILGFCEKIHDWHIKNEDKLVEYRNNLSK